MPSYIRNRDRERDEDAPKSKEKRHKSTRRRSSQKDSEKTSTDRRSSHTTPAVKRKASSLASDKENPVSDNSPACSRSSLPYPSFSKAHCKEAVHSKQDIVNSRRSYYTPDPTDLDRSKAQNEEEEKIKNNTGAAPPSPPLTTVEHEVKNDQEVANSSVEEEAPKGALSTHRKEKQPKRSPENVTDDPTIRVERKRTDLQKTADEWKKKLQRGKSSASSNKRSDRHSSLSKSKNSDPVSSVSKNGKSSSSSAKKPKNRNSVSDEDEETSSLSAKDSRPGMPSNVRQNQPVIEDAASISSQKSLSSLRSSGVETEKTAAESTTDSDATSIAPNQLNTQQPAQALQMGNKASSAIDVGSRPETPALSEPGFAPSRNQTPALSVSGELAAPGSYEDSPAPPPPPPPPVIPFQIPRVDYLMLHGGLHRNIPRNFLSATLPQGSQATPQSSPSKADVEGCFASFDGLLDDYCKVISCNGSLAVATGYRSIARRLLDRLEAVFARDISSEICSCVICQPLPRVNESADAEAEKGINWGEILEYVSGRQDLPPWPAFILDSTQAGLGISSEQQPPMQILDIDVPDEFREHYVRQSKKTKQSVDRWLASQLENPLNAPQDLDDETLTFAMLTRLEPEQRPLFSSLVGISTSRPPSQAAIPLMVPDPTILQSHGLAIQRLYRLGSAPREPETAMYLLKNPSLHNVLATLAAISDGEWEILTSGRFDGFLRSGAEEISNPLSSPSNQHLPSQGSTAPNAPSTSGGPTPPSRGPTPAASGAPVTLDEETEIAVLAEIEREIYLGMESLEDAFEALHCKAESVRRTLRERGAGLSLAAQTRRGGDGAALDARLGTPGGGANGPGVYAWESETDDGFDEAASELMPDDSASNVSRSWRRRPKRRTERRTPAPVEEEDEVDGESDRASRRFR